MDETLQVKGCLGNLRCLPQVTRRRSLPKKITISETVAPQLKQRIQTGTKPASGLVDAKPATTRISDINKRPSAAIIPAPRDILDQGKSYQNNT